MKLRFTLLFLVIISAQAYSQSKNTITAIYGTTDSYINIHGILGDFGYETKRAKVFGLNYSHNFTKAFSVVTGLTSSTDDVEETSIVGGLGEIHHYDQIKMISVPVLAKLSFLKYLYADGGLVFDFQTNYSSASVAPKQSGIGFEGGVGAQYTFNNTLTIFASPYFQYHAIAKFAGGENFELFNAGYKFGIGIGF